ncbi:hypothetical protein OAO01_08885, partial [Oligoflexia bacterium]|nr:hypothetical protein [Oligoflexia bacterium]
MTDFAKLKPGLLLALITILFGFCLGGAFGLLEDTIKTHLKSGYNNSQSKMDKTVSKSWTYFKRAHLHANGIGTTALAVILLLSCLQGCNTLRGL